MLSGGEHHPADTFVSEVSHGQSGGCSRRQGDSEPPNLEREAGRAGALNGIINQAGEMQNENQMRSLSRRSKYPDLGTMVRKAVETANDILPT